ncbi:MAG: hypothetical protein HC795_13370 [Coleofasciculaceae cyanobacterium RL_1_1]|nr:hypothetical protein [Coleofasciculaceae cyanobacterium RL_1_1]
MLSDLSIALSSLNQALQRGELERVGVEAIALYDQTLSLDALQIVQMVGDRALHAGQFSLAIEILAAIVQRDPHQHTARCHLGIAQLSIGQFAQGWSNYDHRPIRRGFIQDMQRYQPHLPLWDGNLEAIRDLKRDLKSYPKTGQEPSQNPQQNSHITGHKVSKKTGEKTGQNIDSQSFNLLVMAEQGFGDAIQFSRYVPLLIDRGIRVTLGCRPPLAKLLATLPHMSADRLLLPGQPPPPIHAFTLLMSLPSVFRTTIDTIPQAVPYLKPGVLSTAGRDLLMSCGLGSALRVGIVWSGSSTRDRDDERSCGLDALLPLLTTPNVTFFSLQKDPLPRDRQRLLSLGVIDLDPFLLDFSDTAAFVAGLDLVISVDTAVVHLAGALGKPVWVALAAVADWRWLTNREDSPWYPQARLFRQPQAGDWRSVVDSMRLALAKLVQSSKPDLRLLAFDSSLDSKLDSKLELKREPELRAEINTELKATIAAFQNQDFETATRLCDRLLQLSLSPEVVETLAVLRGSIAYQRHDLALAIHWFQRSITLNPQSMSSRLNLGNTYRDLGHTQAALNCYAKAEAIATVGHRSVFDIRWERSLALLQAGQWRDGFADYEARLDRKPWPSHIRRHDPHQWDGMIRPNSTLILRMSQGFGDAIQAVRYVPWLKQQGASGLRIAIESRLPLTRLLGTLEGVDAIINVGEPLPAGHSRYDYQAFLMSLPHLCRTTIDTIPDSMPYLRSPGWRDESTRQMVADLLEPTPIEAGSITRPGSDSPMSGRPYKIGVIWSGSPTHAQDFRRSMPLREFATLFDITTTHDGRPRPVL